MAASPKGEPAFVIPEGFSLHTENSARLLLPASADTFLNPVQEFNRDLSVACIRVWSEDLDKTKKETWNLRKLRKVERKGEPDKKRRKVVDDAASDTRDEEPENAATLGGPPETPGKEYAPHKVVILEALSATGLRSIRYANEIPLVKYVLANDLSPAATEAMRRNIALNNLGPKPASDKTVSAKSYQSDNVAKLGKVQVTEGDACALMYKHRPERERVDVVDLDPYGTASPFIDPAVQCVKDGGLLCVTCTDLSVLATTNYPEKCFANYGGIPVKAEYCHEAALRLVLHTISTSAARYGRYITPLLSLSIDFYVRLFVRVKSAPIEVKKAASNTSTYYICTGCQSFYEQPLGKISEKPSVRGNHNNTLYKTHAGPPVSDKCPECHFTMHVAGPMWSGPIHDTSFVARVLDHVESDSTRYGTATRMKGMLTVAKEELHSPFYFTPSRIAGSFHSESPSLSEVASALLNAGHKISRSHACPGSLKTSAPRHIVHDVFRNYIRSHPVRLDKVAENSPTRALLAREASFEADFTRHPDSVTRSTDVKLVRYQQNPTSHWGPGSKPSGGNSNKRKLDTQHE